MQDTFDRKFLNRRTLLIPILLGIMVIVYVAVMHSVQIVHGSEYRARSISSNATTETVGASRGLITDRNGKVLVSNALTYTLTFSRQGFETDSDLNDAIWRLMRQPRRLLQKGQAVRQSGRRRPVKGPAAALCHRRALHRRPGPGHCRGAV